MTTIKRIHGNLLVHVKHGIIVHGCNSKGKMASGFAKFLRAKYPGAYDVYMREFNLRGLPLGGVSYYHHPRELDGSEIVVANAITQENYGRDKDVLYVDYPSISTCFANVATKATELKLPVHFPLIGCGLANGVWNEVGPRIQEALGPDIEATLWIYE